MSAPLKPDFSLLKLSVVIPVYFNQAESNSLTSLLEDYSQYPADILDYIQFVIVDDGSPIPVKIPHDLNLNVSLFRIEKDIPWNQAGARNLGITFARADKVLLADLDHDFPVETLREMIKIKNPGRTFYKMRRMTSSGHPLRSHATTFLLSRGQFLKYYGFDEEFAGNYGCEETWFYKWQRYHGTRFLYLNSKCVARGRDVDREKAYHTLVRDSSYNKVIAQRKKQECQHFGRDAGHSRLFLNFPWKFANEVYRSSDTAVHKEDHWWFRRWYLRWLFGE
ncbi:MAG: glycosyltransferase family A protein [Chlamydiota bacterium]